jgi:hypothetical protein
VTDSLQEELHRAKDTHKHSITVYEKEIRRARKEAFKSSSGLVKMQEEMKAARNCLKMTQATLETEKLKSSKHEQAAFTAQYQLVGVQEEYQKAFERIKILEEERESLKQSLKEEEVSRIAAEGRIALPPTAEDDDADLLSSPTKSPRKIVRSSDSEKENVVPKKAIQLKSLQEELAHERRLRQKAQDQVEFMKMECQFQCCSCRIAEQAGNKYIHDEKYSKEMERIKTTVPVQEPAMEVDVETLADNNNNNNIGSPVADQACSPTGNDTPPEADQAVEDLMDEDDHLERESILRSTPSIMEDPVIFRHDLAPQIAKGEFDSSHTLLQQEQDMDVYEEANPKLEDRPATPEPESTSREPQTPANYEFRTITTTTTVPIMFSPAPNQPQYQPSSLSAPSTPKTISHPGQYKMVMSPGNALKADGTLDREAALELIRQRRGRARSVAMGQATPKKQMVEGNARRDISAPALKTAQTWTR